MILKEELRKIGLSYKESQVYLAALELGETSVNRLALKSKIKRTTVYLVLSSLQEKGLISKTKRNKKTFFLAEDPRTLVGVLEEKKKRLEKIMPELLSFDNLLDKKPGIQYFEGEEGIKTAYKRTLKIPNQEYTAMYSDDYMTDFDETFFFNYYIPQRVKNKSLTRAIFPNTPAMRRLAADNEKQMRQTRFLPAEPFNIKIEVVTFEKNKTLFVSFKEKFALIMESRLIHDSFKNIFETLWMFAAEPEKMKITEKAD